MSLELTAQHQKAIDQLERDHEQRLQEQLQKVKSDYEQRIQQLVEEHEKALAGAQQVAQVKKGDNWEGCLCTHVKVSFGSCKRETHTVVYYPTGTTGDSCTRKESH